MCSFSFFFPPLKKIRNKSQNAQCGDCTRCTECTGGKEEEERASAGEAGARQGITLRGEAFRIPSEVVLHDYGQRPVVRRVKPTAARVLRARRQVHVMPPTCVQIETLVGVCQIPLWEGHGGRLQTLFQEVKVVEDSKPCR